MSSEREGRGGRGKRERRRVMQKENENMRK